MFERSITRIPVFRAFSGSTGPFLTTLPSEFWSRRPLDIVGAGPLSSSFWAVFYGTGRRRQPTIDRGEMDAQVQKFRW